MLKCSLKVPQLDLVNVGFILRSENQKTFPLLCSFQNSLRCLSLASQTGGARSAFEALCEREPGEASNGMADGEIDLTAGEKE